MKPKTKAVTEQIMAAIAHSDKILDIDGGDMAPTMISENEYSFTNDTWVDGPSDRTPGLGRLVYVVTVKGIFVPFNEDD